MDMKTDHLMGHSYAVGYYLQKNGTTLSWVKQSTELSNDAESVESFQ